MTKINNPISNSSKTSKIKKKRASRESQFATNEYFYSWRDMPLSPAFIERMTEELYDWPENNPEAKSITKFYKDKNISPDTWYRLLAKYPKLKEAKEIALHTIGERLWGNAVDKKADWKAVHWRLYKHGREFEEDYEYHKKQSERDVPSGVQYIEIPRYGPPHNNEEEDQKE